MLLVRVGSAVVDAEMSDALVRMRGLKSLTSFSVSASCAGYWNASRLVYWREITCTRSLYLVLTGSPTAVGNGVVRASEASKSFPVERNAGDRV